MLRSPGSSPGVSTRKTKLGRHLDADSDAEHGGSPSSPKKIPEFRQKKLLVVMVTMLAVVGCLFVVLAISHDSGNNNAGAVPPQHQQKSWSSVFHNAQIDDENDVMVEFTAPGLWVPLKNALDLEFGIQPEELDLNSLEMIEDSPRGIHRGRFLSNDDNATAEDSSDDDAKKWPQHLPGVRLLVAITSACCTDVSMKRRAAIRRTWGALSKSRYPQNIEILFFLAQPADKTTMEHWLPLLRDEIKKFNDTVILRGEDTYTSLPNKTFRTMRYALAHFAAFTHVLKCDDDVWVRMHAVMDTLFEKIDSSLLGSSIAARAIGRRVQTALEMAEYAEQNKIELERMSKQRNVPIVSDGMGIYDGTSLLLRRNVKVVVDDIDGTAVTTDELAARAGWSDSSPSPSSQSASNMKKKTVAVPDFGRLRREGLYLGCVENLHGFIPIRDPASKWFVSEESLPDSALPVGVQYHAGWGYILSRDLVGHVVHKVDAYQRQPDLAPLWFSLLHWEDVLVGFLLADAVKKPESHPAFRPAWRACMPGVAVRHLDVDSPRLLHGLVAQDISGLSDEKTVQCSSGQFFPGDYPSWRMWKEKLERDANVQNDE